MDKLINEEDVRKKEALREILSLTEEEVAMVLELLDLRLTKM